MLTFSFWSGTGLQKTNQVYRGEKFSTNWRKAIIEEEKNRNWSKGIINWMQTKLDQIQLTLNWPPSTIPVWGHFITGFVKIVTQYKVIIIRTIIMKRIDLGFLTSVQTVIIIMKQIESSFQPILFDSPLAGYDDHFHTMALKVLHNCLFNHFQYIQRWLPSLCEMMLTTFLYKVC